MVLIWPGLARLGGVTEEEVPLTQQEVTPAPSETGRKGVFAWFGMDSDMASFVFFLTRHNLTCVFRWPGFVLLVWFDLV